MENQQNPQEGNTPGQKPSEQGNNKNNEQNQGKTNGDQNNEDTTQGSGDKFRKHESEDDHRDIPEIGEDDKEIERNTPRM